MKKFKKGLLFPLTLLTLETSAQNLLNLSDWVVGSGGITALAQNGLISENQREWGIGPYGTQVVLWKGSPSGDENGDGGFDSSYFIINNQKTYRYTVWLKKTGSNDGTSYLGCAPGVTTLAGVANNNPYFWYGDLPELNKWYLVVGYVHGSSDPSTTSFGGIYDGTTGKKVVSTTDFKFASNTTATQHRSYLFYDPNINDRQYFYGPRVEEVNGNEPTISSLLNNPVGAGDFFVSGKMGIKTTVPGDYDLAVNGKIRGHEVRVETANWPDYVFKKDYKLPSLAETEKFIESNGHLPDVPKAEEIEADGVSLGEMNKILLKKIEEMTLQLIQLNNEMKKQTEQINTQSEKIKLLENTRIEKLQKEIPSLK
ncbi:hypothetical protein D3C87_511400 [compost metagenome]